MAKYDLITGIQKKALRVTLYGVAGIGKTTLAAQFPNPVFIDVEDGSNQLPVARMPRPSSWEMLMDEVREVRDGNVPCSTIIIDTADAAEELCVDACCVEQGWDGIEAPGWGKGYTYLAEKFGKLLDVLGEVVDHGINVVMVSHCLCRKFELPNEEGAFDRYELKLTKKVAPTVKEWSDTLLFCDYKTIVETETSGKTGKVTKAKAKGGRRIIRTCFHVCWDAKNRFGLPAELPLEYASIAPYVPDMLAGGVDANLQPARPMQPDQAPTSLEDVPAMLDAPLAGIDAQIAAMQAEVASMPMPKPAQAQEQDPRDSYPERLRALADIMRANGVTDAELRAVVAAQGIRPAECPVEQYPEGFPEWLVANFAATVMPEVEKQRVPFDY